MKGASKGRTATTQSTLKSTGLTEYLCFENVLMGWFSSARLSGKNGLQKSHLGAIHYTRGMLFEDTSPALRRNLLVFVQLPYNAQKKVASNYWRIQSYSSKKSTRTCNIWLFPNPGSPTTRTCGSPRTGILFLSSTNFWHPPNNARAKPAFTTCRSTHQHSQYSVIVISTDSSPELLVVTPLFWMAELKSHKKVAKV